MGNLRTRLFAPLSRAGSSPAPRGADAVAVVAIGMHLALALSLRTIGWPEVTTPAYLWSRGLLLYRDVKFVHTPGTMGLLALAFAALGVSTWVIRSFVILWQLIAHAFLLQETAGLAPALRLLTSAFFLVVLFLWEGNSVWPTVLLAALAIPIARAVSRGQVVRASVLAGCAILLKQTAAFILIAMIVRLLMRRKPGDAIRLGLVASVPYTLAGLGFALAGAGADYVQWTLEVPFRIGRLIAVPVPARFFFSCCRLSCRFCSRRRAKAARSTKRRQRTT